LNRRDFEKACKNLDVEKLISALNDRRVDNQEQAAFYLGILRLLILSLNS